MNLVPSEEVLNEKYNALLKNEHLSRLSNWHHTNTADKTDKDNNQ